MATDLLVTPDDRPGVLAQIGEAMARAGVNIDSFCAVTGGGRGEIHLLVEDAGAARAALASAGFEVAAEQEVLLVPAENRPGALAEITAKIAEAGINITVAYLAIGPNLVIGADNLHAARRAVG